MLSDVVMWRLLIVLFFTLLPLRGVGQVTYSYFDYDTGYSLRYVINNGELKIVGSREGHTSEFTIPASIGDRPVTSIDVTFFFGHHTLQSLTIPNSVTEIDVSDFYSAMSPETTTLSSLTSIHVDESHPAFVSVDGILFSKDRSELVMYPSGRSGEYVIPAGVKKVLSGAFTYSYSLTSVSLPDGLEFIGNCAFGYCISIVELVIPDSVTEMREYTFHGCIKLKKITLSNSLKILREGAFSSCESLESVTLPDSVTALSGNTFARCSALKEVHLGSRLKSTFGMEFQYCDSLVTLTFPASLTKMGGGTLYYCSNLKTVIFEGDQAPWHGGGWPVVGPPEDCTIYYYEGASGFRNIDWNAACLAISDEYQSWRNVAFAESGVRYEQSLPNGDCDGDGRSNFREYVFGTDPLRPQGAECREVLASGTDAGLDLRFQIREEAVDAVYRLQVTSNLGAEWEDLATYRPLGAGLGVRREGGTGLQAVEMLPLADGMMRCAERLPVAGETRFVRLKVTPVQ